MDSAILNHASLKSLLVSFSPRKTVDCVSVARGKPLNDATGSLDSGATTKRIGLSQSTHGDPVILFLKSQRIAPDEYSFNDRSQETKKDNVVHLPRSQSLDTSPQANVDFQHTQLSDASLTDFLFPILDLVLLSLHDL